MTRAVRFDSLGAASIDRHLNMGAVTANLDVQCCGTVPQPTQKCAIEFGNDGGGERQTGGAVTDPEKPEDDQ